MLDLVDIHCHGAVGHEFGASANGSRAAADHHHRSGTGTLLASVVSGTADAMTTQVATLAPLVVDGTFAGIHLEGPFLSEARRGAHDPSVLRDPDARLIEALAQTVTEHGVPNALRQMTFAPERDGSMDLVRTLARFGIQPAVGHTDADAATVTAAVDAITQACDRPALITHLFNGMPPMHHRAGGPVAAALAAAGRGDAYVELIADGVHVSPDVVRMVFETVGPQRITLVSDAMAATGLGDGRYELGTLQVDVVDGAARLTGGGSIAGSTATLADCVRWCIDVAGLPRDDVLVAATQTPRAALQLNS